MAKSIASVVAGQHRLLQRAVRQAAALVAASTALGLATMKRRYRRRKKKSGTKAAVTKPTKGKKGATHLTRSREEE